MGIGMIFIVVLTVAVVALIARAAGGASVFNTGQTAIRQGDSETPLEILRKRYARGEIDKAEFNERRKDLA
jgi:putative membrane protein